jgi:hypothetical protein
MEIANDALMTQDFKQAMDLLYHVFIIEDNYTNLRMEWIYGIPQINTKFTENSILSTYTFSKYGEKLYKYISPLMSGTNHDSLIDKIIRLQSHTEFIQMLNYFFAIVLKKPFTFNYFDCLPSPKEMNLSLKDYLFELVGEELSRPYFVTNKQNEKSIALITKIMEKYDTYKNDFASKSSRFIMRANYKLGSMSKEYTEMIIDEKLNLNQVYLMSLDYESEIISANSSQQVIRTIDTIEKPKEQTEVDDKNEENEFQLIKSEEKETKEISSNFTSKLIENSNMKNQELIYNNEKYLNANQFNSGKNEEEYYKKIIWFLMDHMRLVRTFVIVDPSSKLLANSIKKYVIYNSNIQIINRF